MKTTTLLLLFLFSLLSNASPAAAARIFKQEWHPATQRFVETTQFAQTFDSSPWAKASSPIGDFLKDAVKISRAPAPVSIIPKTLELVQGPTGAFVLNTGVAFLPGGLGAACQIAMAAKDIYDWAQESPSNKAYFNGLAPAAPALESSPKIGDTVSSGGMTWTVYNITYDTGSQTNPGGTSCQSASSTDHSPSCWMANSNNYRRYWLNPASSPTAPNAASSDINSWYNALSANASASPGYSPYPNMDTGLQLAMNAHQGDDKTQISISSDQYKKFAKDVASEVAQQTALQQSQTVQTQYSAARVRLAGGTGSQAEVDELKRLRESLDAQAAKDKAADAADAAVTMPSSSPDALHVFDWSPLLRLKGALSQAFPFNLLGQISGLLSLFVGTPVAPRLDLPLPIVGTIHLDLAVLDPVAAICRWVFGIMLTIATIFGVNAFFRGVS